MAPRKRDERPLAEQLTESGLWSTAVGEYGRTVRVREDKDVGSNVVFDYRDPETGKRVVAVVDRRESPPEDSPPQGFSVRKVKGRAGQAPKVDPELAKLARDRAEQLRARIMLRAEVDSISPARLTYGQGWAKFMDPERGGLPPSATRRATYRLAQTRWLNFMGVDRPWNRGTPADVWALAVKLRDEVGYPTARETVKCLSAVWSWLTKKARIRGLENPVAGFEWKKLEDGYESRQERYSREELLGLIGVRYQVDPRYALMVVLSTAAIKRNVEVRLIRRSQVDARRPINPSRAEAPFGWIWFPGVKGQDAAFHFLTRWQREALFEAMYGADVELVDAETGEARTEWRRGYLRELERAYQAGEIPDYWLFPGRRLKQGIIPPGRPSAANVVANLRPREWLYEAERIAEIPHIEWRGWHGVRRGMSDLMEELTDLGVVTALGNWSSQATPEKHYLDRKRFRKLGRARKVLEGVFGEAAEDRDDLIVEVLDAVRRWARGRTTGDPDSLALIAAARRLFPEDGTAPERGRTVGDV